jgi:hypothetical protein
MRAHILEDQVAEFPGAIAGELAGRHQPAGQRRSQDRRMRDLDRDLLFSAGVTAHNDESYDYGHASSHRYGPTLPDAQGAHTVASLLGCATNKWRRARFIANTAGI